MAAADVRSWTRFARRVVTEIRTDPGQLGGIVSDDLLDQWSALIDRWFDRSDGDTDFRWSETLDCEMAEFLLHGLERCFHSTAVQARVTQAESAAQRSFTMHVIQAFVVGLEGEGETHCHYADQVRASLGDSLP